ncbi:MAG: lysoplasmalogenase [Balneola sp.]
MNLLTLIFIVKCFVACIALLFAEKHDNKLGKWIFKITASSAFVLIALTLADIYSSFSNWMLIGFLFSFFGDVFLIKSNKSIFFKSGVVSFACAHIAFIIAFISIGSFGILFLLSTTAAIILMIYSYVWLKPKVNADFMVLVAIYILIIGSMCALSGYAWEGIYRNGVLVGAFLFAVSDLFVAKEKFIKTEFRNKLIGLPVYYIAQIFLALSLDW